MFSESTNQRLLPGLAMLALTALGHAFSIIAIQATGQTATPSWLEPLVLDGAPREGVIGVLADEDYFRMAVTGPTAVVIYSRSSFDTVGTLFDPDGREIAGDDDSGDGRNFSITTVLPRRGTYYLRARAFGRLSSSSRRATGGYTIHAERANSPQLLSLGDSPREGSISTGGESRFYRLEVTVPTRATFYTSGSLNTTGWLLGPDGREIERDYSGGEGSNFRIEAFLPRRGTYYLLVRSYRAGSYTLHTEQGETPQLLSLGGTPREGSISTARQTRLYRLEVTVPTQVILYTSGSLLDTTGALVDTEDRIISQDDDGGESTNFRIETFLPRRGTYFLRVRGYSSSTGSYTLHAERGELPMRLSLGGPALQGSIEESRDADVYFLDVTGPTGVAIYTTGGFDSVGSLFDPDNRLIATDDDGGDGLNFRIDTFLVRSGTYSLEVTKPFFGKAGTYSVQAARGESPTLLLLGGPPQQGAILTGGAEDLFRLQVTNPTRVAISTSGGVDTGGELYDPQGELIATDDDGGDGENFRINAILLRRGTYVLRIVPSHPASTGSYTLHTSVVP